MADDTPAYFRLYYDVWQAVRSLPRAKAAKLLYAMADYFFEGTEPDEGELPVAAQRMFDIQKASIASYRRNALNGCRNRRNRTKNDPETVSKPTSKTASKTTPKTNTVLKGSQEGLPAETQKVGHKHSGKHSGKSASNIINHESLISSPPPALLPSAEQSRAAAHTNLQEPTSNTLQVVTGTETARAAAGVAKGRPAAALPSQAEYERVERLLETEGLDALTPEDRRVYHEGHAIYAAKGVTPE